MKWESWEGVEQRRGRSELLQGALAVLVRMGQAEEGLWREAS